MRKTKKLIINGKEIIIQELTQRQIRDALTNLTNPGEEAASQSWPIFLLNQIPKLAGIPYDEWLDFTPSDTEEIIRAMKEVNASFLQIPGLLESWGLGAAISQFKQACIGQIERISQAISQAITSPNIEAQPPLQDKKLHLSNDSDTPKNPDQKTEHNIINPSSSSNLEAQPLSQDKSSRLSNESDTPKNLDQQVMPRVTILN